MVVETVRSLNWWDFLVSRQHLAPAQPGPFLSSLSRSEIKKNNLGPPSRSVLPSSRRSLAARAESSPGGAGGGKRISQNEFTEKAWQAIVAAPDVAKAASNQIVETEHLLKALLEQPNGLARRCVAAAGGDPSLLLERVDAFVKRQPRVSGDSGQVLGRNLEALG